MFFNNDGEWKTEDMSCLHVGKFEPESCESCKKRIELEISMEGKTTHIWLPGTHIPYLEWTVPKLKYASNKRDLLPFSDQDVGHISFMLQ